MTVADLTVVEFFGLQALALALFYLMAAAVRAYDPEWPRAVRVQYWACMVIGPGSAVYLGLTALFPGLPTF